MSQSAYQPGYTITPKYGQRYMNSSFAPAVGAPQSAAVSQPSAPPQPAGQGYSMANPFAGNAQFTQAQQNYSTNIGSQPTVGFRRAIPGVQGAGPSTPPVGTVPGMPAPPSTSGGVTQAASSGGDDPMYSPDYRPAAQALGYSPTKTNPLAGLLAVGIPGGSFLSSQLGLTNEYGKPGTYDAQGNVFGKSGRAYNPVTGAAAQSYASPAAYKDNLFGSYGQLRTVGESPLSAGLGSYENSIYNVSREDRMRGYSPGELAGVNTMQAQARRNAEIMGQDMYNEADLFNIDAQMLGFDPRGPAPTAPSSGTYAYGTGAGDVFTTGAGYQTGVINESGQIETPTGTIVQTSDTQGNTVSLLGTPEDNFANIDYLSNTTNDFKSDDDGFGVGGGTTFGDQVKAEEKVSLDAFGGSGDDDSDSGGK